MALAATTPSQNVLAAGFVLILLGLGVSYFFLLPRLETANSALSQADGQLASDGQNLASAQQAKQKVDAVTQALSAKGLTIAEIQQVLPATEQLPSLYIQMEAISSANAATGATYQLGTPAIDPKSNVAEIPLTVTASGEYPALKALLAAYENNVRPAVFTQISFATASAASASSSSGSSSQSAAAAKGPVTLTATGYFEALALSPQFATTTPQ